MEVTTWWDRRVFVTGATGIVGSWLVKELLCRGSYVVVLIHNWDPQSELIRSGDVRRTNVVQGSLEEYGTIERAINEHEIDTVYHLGAQTIVGTALRSPVSTFETNIRGSYNLLEACRVHGELVRRVVVASSDKAYGDSKVLPYTEEMPPLGRHPYDVSKSCTDLLAQSYHHTYGLPVVIARCGNIYGGGDLNWSRIVPGTIRSLLRGEQPVLRSDGTFTRDYIYVKDVVNAYLQLALALERPGIPGQAFNFGPERPLTVLEIVDRIRSLMNLEELDPIVLSQVKSEIHDQYLSCEKAIELLGWRPRYSLENGLQETINWYRAFLGA